MENHRGKPTKLRVILSQKGITQKELAKISDIEIYQISGICSGLRKNMTMDTAKKIARALGVTLDEAFGDDIETEDTNNNNNNNNKE